MSLKGFQSALADLYLKSSFRKGFFSRPRASLRRYDLDAREKRALAGIDRRSLERFCAGLALKNSARLRAKFRGENRPRRVPRRG